MLLNLLPKPKLYTSIWIYYYYQKLKKTVCIHNLFNYSNKKVNQFKDN
jgi:hypothetical protein